MFPYLAIEYFNVFGFKFYSWGFFIALAFLVGLILSVKAAKRFGISADKIVTLIVLVYVGAIAGSRLFFILQWPGEFLKDPAVIFNITQGGMMFYGGLFGGILAGWLYIRKWENRWQVLGALGSVVPFALAIGRIGCFLNSDHPGALTNAPWAMQMPDGALRHPVAFYLILFDLALAAALYFFRRHSESRVAGRGISRECGTSLPRLWRGDSSGGFFADSEKSAFRTTNSFILFFFLYPLGRFFLDFTRDASVDPHIWGLATSQWISLALLTSALLYAILIELKNRQNLA